MYLLALGLLTSLNDTFQQVMSPEPLLQNELSTLNDQKPMSDRTDSQTSVEDLFKHKDATFPCLSANNYSTWSKIANIYSRQSMSGQFLAVMNSHLRTLGLLEIWQTFYAHMKKNSRITTSATREPQSSTTLSRQTLVPTLIQPNIHLRCGLFSDSAQARLELPRREQLSRSAFSK